jgi:hypothetical protein
VTLNCGLYDKIWRATPYMCTPILSIIIPSSQRVSEMAFEFKIN